MRKVFLSVFMLLVLHTYAQTDKIKKSKWRFHSLNQFGLLNGEGGVSGNLQSVNGFEKNNWFIGAGAAIDYYLYRTAPLFIDVRKAFGEKRRKLFVYADGGWNIAWVKKENETVGIWWPATPRHYSNGLYTDAGFGYAIGTKQGDAFLLSLGHSYKYMRATYGVQDWRTGEIRQEREEYKFNRLVIKAGWKF
jgi:hypothetical protein